MARVAGEPPPARARVAERKAARAAGSPAWWAPRPCHQAEPPWRGGERRAGPSKAPAGLGAGFSATRAMSGEPRRRVPATRERRADQILMRPPGVSAGGRRPGVAAAEGTRAWGCCFALRLPSLFPSPFLISDNPPLTQPEFQQISSLLNLKKKKNNKK